MVKLHRALLVAGLTAAWAPSARADEPGPRAVRLDEAISLARAHAPALAAARLRELAATSEVDAVRAQWSPRVGAFAQVVGATANNSTTTLLGVSTVDVPRVGGTKVSSTMDLAPYASTALALGVRQQVFDFGRIAAERAAAEAVVEIERTRVAGAGIDLASAVEQAFWAVLAARAVEDATVAAVARATRHRDQAKANAQSGMRPPIELTRAEADLARYEAATLRATASVHVARSVLAAVVSVPELELDASPTDATPAALPTLASALDRGANSPLVAELRARVAAQRAETARLAAQSLPNLFATAAVTTRAGGSAPSAGPVPVGDGWLPVVPNYDLAIVLAWPLVEPTLDRRVDAARARASATSAEAELTVRAQRAAIASAWREADVAVRSLDALARAAEAGRANYEQAERRFEVGLGTSTEIADAQAIRTDLEIQLATARYQVMRARASLARAIAEVR